MCNTRRNETRCKVLDLIKRIKAHAKANIQTRKKVNFDYANRYLKLKLQCRICSDQVKYQNFSQLRYHVAMHDESLKRDIYLELLQ